MSKSLKCKDPHAEIYILGKIWRTSFAGGKKWKDSSILLTTTVQTRINIPIVVPTISTGNALHWVSLRYCCVQSTTLVRKEVKGKRKKSAEGAIQQQPHALKHKTVSIINGYTMYFHQLPKQCYAYHYLPIFTNESCTILKLYSKNLPAMFSMYFCTG